MSFITADVVVRDTVVTLKIKEQNGYLTQRKGETFVPIGTMTFTTSSMPELDNQIIYLKGSSNKTSAARNFINNQAAKNYAKTLVNCLKKLNSMVIAGEVPTYEEME